MCSAFENTAKPSFAATNEGKAWLVQIIDEAADVLTTPDGAESLSRMPTKVNSLWSEASAFDRLAFALRLRETGLRMSSPEKSRDSDPVLCRAFRSLQSVLLRNYREKRASFACFGVKDDGISLQLRLAGGGSGIRTLGTVLPR